MKLNEVYLLMNNLIRGNINIDIDRKIMALNEGYKYLAIRFHELGSPLQELIVEPTNISNLADVNYVNLPDNYFSLLKLYRKVDTNSYEPLYKDQIIPYERLIDISGPMFLDTTNTGIVTMAAVKEPKIFFDVHFEDVGTDNIKISYDSLPEELTTYDEVPITSVSGTFVAGDTVEVVSDIINPTESLATATILEVFIPDIDDDTSFIVNASLVTFLNGTYNNIGELNGERLYSDGSNFLYYNTDFGFNKWAFGLTTSDVLFYSDYITGSYQPQLPGGSGTLTVTINSITLPYIKIQNRSGLFTQTLYAVVGDLTTPTYTAVGLISGATESNPQVLKISAKYKMLLANAGALMYLYMEDDIEAEAKQKTLDDMINQFINMNISKENIKVRFYG